MRHLCGLLTFVVLLTQPAVDGLNQYEPYFPNLFEPSVPLESRQIVIVSESSSADGGSQTIREYLDLASRRSTIVRSTGNRQQVVFTDANSGLSYSYRAYSCNATKISEIQWEDLHVKMMLDGTKQDEATSLPIQGVAGLWLYAANKRRRYVASQEVYSSTSNARAPAYVWTVEDSSRGQLINLTFVEGLIGPFPFHAPLRLNSIQVESAPDRRPLKTFNVLSIEYEIDEATREELLEVPLGFGCPPASEDISEDRQVSSRHWLELMLEHSLIKLEVTSSKFVHRPNQPAERFSDAFDLELAHSSVGPDRLHLFRVRNRELDLKTIFNYRYNVRYSVDMRQGTCQMGHFEQNTQLMQSTLLSFNNGLELDISFGLMMNLFSDGLFVLTKRTPRRPGRAERYFYEGTLDTLAGLNRTCRLVRSYVKDNDLLKLESVTVWVLDPSLSQVEQSYHFSVLDSRLLSVWPDEPKVFDVSEECYLNDDRRRSGRDYAWLELTYPVSGRLLQQLSANEQQVKRTFYESFLRPPLDFSRVPRLELEFDEDGFRLRMLLLDLPPLDMVFNEISGYELASDGSEGNNGLDLNELAPDLAHCAEFCRLNHCNLFSFCQLSHSCSLSSRRLAALNIGHLLSNQVYGCSTYKLPLNSAGELLDLRLYHAATLQAIIASLRRQDYQLEPPPEQPDELSEPQSESGLSEADLRRAINEYLAKLTQFLETKGDRMPELTISMSVGDRWAILMPSKFQVENDPLQDFDPALAGLQDEDELFERDQRPSAFHKGLMMAKYRVPLVGEQPFRLLKGLSYEQCSMVCLDSKCNSFSYCQGDGQCVLSKLNSVAEAKALGALDEDPKCFVAQRDFLSNFLKFERVDRPLAFDRALESSSPSDCATSCLAQPSFRCLSFEFCTSQSEKGTKKRATCYFRSSRGSNGESSATIKTNLSEAPSCDHYTRSYLADFVRLEGHKFESSQLDRLPTSNFEGRSVFKCAEICATQLADCSAFQFCFKPEAEGTKQECTMIEGKPDNGSYKMVTDNKTREPLGGSYLEVDQNCQIFALRSDTAEAHLRDLAVAVTGIDGTHSTDGTREGAGLTLGASLLLFLSITMLTAATSLGLALLRNRNERFRSKLDDWRTTIRARVLGRA